MHIDPALVARARVEQVEVEITDLIRSDLLAADFALLDEVPQYLRDAVAEYRLQLERLAPGRWLLGPLGD